MSGWNKTSRTIWLIAICVGVLYWLGSLARSGIALEELAALPKPLVVGIKGLFSLLLALSVFLARRSVASSIIAVALAVSAVGDMLLVTVGSVAGGIVFAAAHVVAGYAYAMNRCAKNSSPRWIAAVAVPVLAVAASYLVLRSSDQPALMALYPAISGTMAGLAILSRFPLRLSGLGAAIFVVSDVLFLADLGILNGSGKLGFLTWATYAIGYAMVARGAAQFENE